MANTGNVFVGTGESVDRAGLTAWTNPGNVISDNTTDATCSGTGSDYLVGRNADLSAIPDTATIDGILVRVEASEHSGGTEPLLAQLQDAAAALVGNAKSTSNEGSISGTAKAVYTYGGTADLWGATLTPAIVKDPDFGVRCWFVTSHDVRVDYITLAVEYHTVTQVTGSATLSAAAVLTAVASVVTPVTASATLQGVASITAMGEAVTPDQTVSGSATLTGASSLAAIPTALVTAAATMTGVATVAASPTVLVYGNGQLLGVASLAVQPAIIYGAVVTMIGEGAMTATPTMLGDQLSYSKAWYLAALIRHGRHRA